MTPAQLRPLAGADLVERTRYYRSVGGPDLAERFFDAAIEAVRGIERMPGIGSPRMGELCDIPGLRVRRVSGFPCSWCYFVRADHLDVARLLADSQNFTGLIGIDSDAEDTDE